MLIASRNHLEKSEAIIYRRAHIKAERTSNIRVLSRVDQFLYIFRIEMETFYWILSCFKMPLKIYFSACVHNQLTAHSHIKQTR